MTLYLDLSALQSVPAANLNRDDLGSPKQVRYGNAPRIRVSSQSWKRVIRLGVEQDLGEKAARTRLVPAKVQRALESAGWPTELAAFAGAQVAASAGKKGIGTESAGHTSVLLFLPEAAIDELAAVCAEHRQALEAAQDKKKPGQVLPPQTIEAILKRRTASISLLGRMLAELPDANVDGAAQVAHAFTTHAAEPQRDYFTAVDDWLGEAETGSGHLDTAEFSAGVFYRYATVNVADLLKNLEGDVKAVRTVLSSFAEHFLRGADDTGVCAQAREEQHRPAHRPGPGLLAGRDHHPGPDYSAGRPSVVCVGAGGVRAYAGILPDSLTTHWLEQQVATWADPTRRLEVAVRMYRMRFKDADVPESVTLDQLRGMEGQRMKAFYKILAQQHGIGRFRPQIAGRPMGHPGPRQPRPSAANTCLYGVVHAALLALGLSPALGYVHAGTQHAFIYDIADLYKADITLPLAFALHSSDNPEQEARRRPRRPPTPASPAPHRPGRPVPADPAPPTRPQPTMTLTRNAPNGVTCGWSTSGTPKPESSQQASTTPKEAADALHGRHRHHRGPRPPARRPQPMDQRSSARHLRRQRLGPRP
ncbi:CRISPR-associated endonuclease Cas1 [Streptomyces hirsutus]